MLDAVAVAQNNKHLGPTLGPPWARLGPGSSASGLLTDPKPIPKTNSQTLNLDVPAITNLNLIPSVPVLPRPPYRFHPGVYKWDQILAWEMVKPRTIIHLPRICPDTELHKKYLC